MYNYKDFIYQITKLSITQPHVMILESIIPNLKSYIRSLDDLKYDNNAHHVYYGQVKKLISSFLIFFARNIDDVTKEADKCVNVMDKEELLRLIEETISMHHENQIAFGKEYLPVQNDEEKHMYEDMEETFNIFISKINEIKEQIQRFEKQKRVDDFSKAHFESAIKNSSELFHYTHFYISMMLADRANYIRISIEEIHLRMKNNLTKMEEEFSATHTEMLEKLYDKNKENLNISRSNRRSSVQAAEVSRCIDNLRYKIENHEKDATLLRLENEVEFWQNRVQQFHECFNNLNKIEKELKNIEKEEKIYSCLQNTDIPGPKRQCWIDMGKTLADKREKLIQLKVTECKTLLTFFAARGYDRIYYKDNIGTYYMDEFKHQIYATSQGLGTHHVNCEGEFVDPPEIPYYFDQNGRYILENGKKIYQAAVCTSQYDLGADNIFKKITKDCGHSERHNPDCRMEITDPNKYEILPTTVPVDIKGRLDSETVKYLWDCFGSILPDALYDVCMKQPHNPIHYLAHRLIYHKYSKNAQELAAKQKEAQEYRANVYKERKDKDIAASKAWETIQWKRAKPEDFDNAHNMDFNTHVAQQEFMQFINAYNATI